MEDGRRALYQNSEKIGRIEENEGKEGTREEQRERGKQGGLGRVSRNI